MSKLPEPICIGCKKRPDEIQEYVDESRDEDNFEPITPTEAVRCDGTYNQHNGHFWCTECYAGIGCPLGVAP